MDKKQGTTEITYCQYQQLVRKQAWGRFRKDHLISGIVVPVIIGLLVGVVQSLLLVGRIEPVITALVTAAITALIYSILYIWYFSREHVSIYNKDRETIRGYVDKYGGDRIQTSKITLVPDEHNKDREMYAWLMVKNEEDHDLDNCYAEIIGAKENIDGVWEDKTHETHGGDTKLTFRAHGSDKEIVIRRDSSDRFSVANLGVNGVVNFTHLKTGNPIGNGTQERVYVEIAFNAEMRGKYIEPVIFRGFLVREFIEKAKRVYLEAGELPDKTIEETTE